MEGIHTSLGLIEVASIARGYIVSDAMVKKAPVALVESRAVTPGKYVVLVSGDVAEVDEAMQAGLAVAGDNLLDQLFLPQADAQLAPRLRGEPPPEVALDAMALCELHTVSATLLSADAAVKAADVWLLEMRLAVGIGGKGYYSMTGELHQVQAAVEAAALIAPTAMVNAEIIARPHEDLAAFLSKRGRAP